MCEVIAVIVICWFLLALSAIALVSMARSPYESAIEWDLTDDDLEDWLSEDD